jgi:hypothetical protein
MTSPGNAVNSPCREERRELSGTELCERSCYAAYLVLSCFIFPTILLHFTEEERAV